MKREMKKYVDFTQETHEKIIDWCFVNSSSNLSSAFLEINGALNALVESINRSAICDELKEIYPKSKKRKNIYGRMGPAYINDAFNIIDSFAIDEIRNLKNQIGRLILEVMKYQ